MADKVDIANDYQQQFLDSQIEKQRQKPQVQESSEFCNECGEMIPDERRKAVPGVDTCVHCRTIQERRAA